MHDISAKRASALLVAYVLLYVPGMGVVSVVEGGLRGKWGLSLDDWMEQMGTYGAFFALPVSLAGVIAVPLVLAAAALASGWRRTVAGAVAGVAGVVGGLLFVQDIATFRTSALTQAWPLEWVRMFP